MTLLPIHAHRERLPSTPVCLRTGVRALFVALALSACAASPSGASTLPDRFSDQVVTGGLNDPVGFAFTPDGRMVVVERAGAVRFIVEGKLGAVDPMVVIDSVATDGDRGLTGVAVDPQWPTRPFIYVYYDHMNGSCRIERYTAEGDLNSSSGIYLTIDPASRFRLLADIPDLQNLHNGGTLRFGPDGMLYAALGDDGDGCAAQDTTSLRGVALRMDVRGLPTGPGGPPLKDLLVPSDNPLVAHPNPNARLIYANGLRNPFRFHIDPVDGDIFIGDVGFNLFEEVDVIDSGLQNFGWPYYEGPAGYVGSCPGIVQGGALTSPIYAYDRTGFTASVIGGGVYRGSTCTPCNFPAEYEGDYFLSDFYAGFLRRLTLIDGQWFLAAPVPGQPTAQDWGLGFEEVADYLVGPDGALWYCKMSYDFTPGTGEIRRIYYTPPVNDATPASPRDLSFAPPAPMPARGPVRFSWTQPVPADVALRVFDPQGRLTRTVLAPGTQPAGAHEARWNGDDDGGVRAAPGVYLAQLVVGGHALQRRVVLVR